MRPANHMRAPGVQGISALPVRLASSSERLCTPRQLQILARLADGQTRNKICHDLGIGHSTMNEQVMKAAQRLGVDGQGKVGCWKALHWLAFPPVMVAWTTRGVPFVSWNGGLP